MSNGFDPQDAPRPAQAAAGGKMKPWVKPTAQKADAASVAVNGTQRLSDNVGCHS
jgi:hypothetical protein